MEFLTAKSCNLGHLKQTLHTDPPPSIWSAEKFYELIGDLDAIADNFTM